MKSRTMRMMIAATVLVTVISGGMLFRALSGALASWRAFASRRHSMAQIVLSLHNYRDAKGKLPASTRRDELGRPLTSWRLELLPFMEQMSWGFDGSVSWLVPHNITWLREPIGRVFRLDDDFRGSASVETRLLVITGPGTAFPGDDGYQGELPADLILVVEMADSHVAWTQPGDLDVRSVPASITQGLDGQGVHVGFADGEVWYLDRSVPLDTLQVFFTVEGARSHDRQPELLPFRRD